ncbi:MAG: LacI family DNA-binding transcriptional regulator [Mucilaginibacter sp.]|uniref:LacI family DNA-binding transcriptional regulator n=1 Tax=Mucilaginibacter sp. TaxID=1882438 RepID=UPI0034E5912E
MKKKISIKDIAQQLNISITTVSFILNGKAKEMRISDKLITKVNDFMKEKNYHPNQFAQSLRTGKTKIIALFVEDIADSFFAGIARLIEESAYQKGYKIIYCSTEDNLEKTRELIQLFKSRNVDGYIITPPKGLEKELKQLLQEDLPFVLFDRFFPKLSTDYVIIDNFKGTYEAIKHFQDQDFKHIAFITLDSGQTQMNERLRGYELAMDEFKLPKYILKIPFKLDIKKVTDQFTAFFLANKAIDAVLFATNYLAVKGFETLRNLKIRIPEDIAVIAFDDHEFFKVFNPSITAVAQPMKELSDHLISILLEKLNPEKDDKPNPQNQIVLPAQLLIRESSLKK